MKLLFINERLQITKNISVLLSVAILLLTPAGTRGQETDQDRIKKLEEAVRRLEQQNELLRKEMQELRKAPSTAPIVGPADAKPPAPSSAAAAAPASASAGDLKISWKDGLNLESADGKIFKGKIGGRIQLDAAGYEADDDLEDLVGDLSTATEFRRVRLHSEGTLDMGAKTFYKIELDFAGGDVALKDVFLGVEQIPVIGTIQAGHFKEPFGLEELTSSRYITFLERSMPNEAFTTPMGRSDPRNTGIMVRNSVWDDRMTWAVGGFADVDDSGAGIIDSNYHLTARITGTPWYEDKGAKLVHLGLAGGLVEPEGDTLRFRSRPESHLAPRFVDTRAFEADRVYRLAAEAAIVCGPFSLQGEYMQNWVETPIADPAFDGFYVFGSWFITGEHRPYRPALAVFDRVKPKKNFSLDGGGAGAWELALRYSRLDLNDEGISGGRLQNVTGAINWYLNPNTRLMFNYVFADLDRGPVDDENAHIFQTRLQVDF